MRREVQGTQPRGKALIVCGMHRSGTSAMARVLALAGGAMPDRLIRAASDNPHGFWEPEEMVSLNDEIFRSVGSTWNDPFGFRMIDRVRAKGEDFLVRARSVVARNYQGARLPVAKDPRTSLLAPLWRDAFEAEGFEPVFVIMARHPLEVARSISARGETADQASTLAWLSHLIAIERDTRDVPRVFVAYENLLEDWQSALDRIGSELEVELFVSPDSRTAISEFLVPTDRHHAVGDDALESRTDIWPGVKTAWSWLRVAARGREAEGPFPSAVTDGLSVLEACLGPVLASERQARQAADRTWQATVADKDVEILRLRAQADEYRAAQARLMEDGRESVERVTTQAAKEMDQLRDRLGHVSAAAEAAKATSRQLQAALDAAQEELDQALMTLAEERQRSSQLALDRADLATSLEAAVQRVQELESARVELQRQVADGETALRRLAAIQTSTSWAVARPLRVLEKRYKSIVRRD